MMAMLKPEWIIPKKKITSINAKYEHLYDEIKALSDKGVRHKEIAKRYGIGEFSVNKLLVATERY